VSELEEGQWAEAAAGRRVVGGRLVCTRPLTLDEGEEDEDDAGEDGRLVRRRAWLEVEAGVRVRASGTDQIVMRPSLP
jgi:hypothetical protein